MHNDPADGENRSPRSVFRGIGIGIALALLVGCAADRAPPVAADSGGGAGVTPLRAAAAACSRQHGYEPAAAPDPAESRALMPNELKWRQCVYDAIRQRIETAPPLVPIYEQLIAEDLLMTTEIQQGALTRSARHRRLEELTSQVAEAEAAYARSEQAAELQERAELRQVYDVFREMTQ